MGNGTVSLPMCLVMAALLLMAMVQPASAASQSSNGCEVETLVLEDQFRLTLTIGPWLKIMDMSDLGIIIVPPVLGAPEKVGDARYLRLEGSYNLSFASNLMLNYVPISYEGAASEGDRIIIRSTGTSGLPHGQWQLYVVEVSSSDSLLGIIWTIGDAPVPDYPLAYARSSIDDPMQRFGFSSQGSDWIFVAIIGSEVLLLAVIVFLIGRTK